MNAHHAFACEAEPVVPKLSSDCEQFTATPSADYNREDQSREPDNESLPGRNTAYASLSRGWALGSKEFKTALVKDHALAAHTRAWETSGAKEVRAVQWRTALIRGLRALQRSQTEIEATAKSASWKLALAEWVNNHPGQQRLAERKSEHGGAIRVEPKPHRFPARQTRRGSELEKAHINIINLTPFFDSAKSEQVRSDQKQISLNLKHRRAQLNRATSDEKLTAQGNRPSADSLSTVARFMPETNETKEPSAPHSTAAPDAVLAEALRILNDWSALPTK